MMEIEAYASGHHRKRAKEKIPRSADRLSLCLWCERFWDSVESVEDWKRVGRSFLGNEYVTFPCVYLAEFLYTK